MVPKKSIFAAELLILGDDVEDLENTPTKSKVWELILEIEEVVQQMKDWTEDLK